MAQNNTPMDQWLARGLVVSQIVSILAIPVVLALIGYWVQQTLQDQQIKRDYVTLAISLLAPQTDKKSATPPELREWAVQLLNESAPVKLSSAQAQAIQATGISLDALTDSMMALPPSAVPKGVPDGQLRHEVQQILDAGKEAKKHQSPSPE